LADGCFLFLHFALFFEKRLMLFKELVERPALAAYSAVPKIR
jgi:hypothetical protein